MGVTATPRKSLTSTAGASSYQLGSSDITLTAGKLYLLSVFNRRGAGTADTAAISGSTVTWASAVTVTSGSVWRMTIFRCIPSSTETSVSLTATFANAHVGCVMELAEVYGFDDTGGSNGSAAIVNTATNGASNNNSTTVTLSAFGNARNVGFGAFGMNSGSNSIGSPGTGIHQVDETGDGVTAGTYAAFGVGLPNDTTIDWSHSGTQGFGVAVEIRADLERGDIYNLVASGDGTNKSSGGTYTFTVPCTSGNLYLMGIRLQTASGTAAVTSVASSGSETVTNIATRNLGSNAVLLNSAWWFIASATATRTITVTVGGAGLTYAQGIWTVDEVAAPYFDAASPIVASNGADNTSTTPTLTFAAPSHSRAILWGSMCINVATLVELNPTSPSELGESLVESRIEASAYQYPDVGASMTWSSTSGAWVGIGAEVRPQQSPTRVVAPVQAVQRAGSW